MATAWQFGIVTGASSGIGLELAQLCAQHSYDLLIAAADPTCQRLEEQTAIHDREHQPERDAGGPAPQDGGARFREESALGGGSQPRLCARDYR